MMKLSLKEQHMMLALFFGRIENHGWKGLLEVLGPIMLGLERRQWLFLNYTRS
jgi:hypothetical protein